MWDGVDADVGGGYEKNDPSQYFQYPALWARDDETFG
jgi:hypothetical protein